MKTSDDSLVVYIGDIIVYKSSGKWLYPLFELEAYNQNKKLVLKKALYVDKVVGKASALLITRLGAGKVHGKIMSQLAIDVFCEANIPFSYDQLVEQVECKTELILKDVSDPEEAYQILKERANL